MLRKVFKRINVANSLYKYILFSTINNIVIERNIYYNVCMKCKVKVKRPRVNWYEVLMSSNDDKLIHAYYEMRVKTRWQQSENRCALAVIRHYYSNDKIERIRWLGESL